MRLLPQEWLPGETSHVALGELPGFDSLGQPRPPRRN
jgi:hypothetical protein